MLTPSYSLIFMNFAPKSSPYEGSVLVQVPTAACWRIADIQIRPPPARDFLHRRNVMVIGIANLHPLIAIVAGVLILIQPKLLNAVVAIYLILTGILELGLLR